MGEHPGGRLRGLGSPSEEGVQNRPHPGQLQGCGVIGDGDRDGVEHLLGLGGTMERESQSDQPGDGGLGSLGVAASHSVQRSQLGIAEFGAGAVEVALDGADRDDEPVGDLAVGQPAGGQGDDLPFSAGQW